MSRLRAIGDASTTGQALVEMSLVLILLLTIVLATFEMGLAFDHHLTLKYASREGARTGSAMANGGGALGCGVGQSPMAAAVDPNVIAAVQRVLTGHGTPVPLADVVEIRIYRAGADGQELGPVNVWRPSAGGGPEVSGTALDFVEVTAGWPACSRINVEPNAHSIGVSIEYVYRLQTPFRALFGWTTIGMVDRTIMRLNPTGV